MLLLINKYFKWVRSFARLILLKLYYGNRLVICINKEYKPVYIGRRTKINISRNAKIILRSGVYISDDCTLEAFDKGCLEIKENVFLNTFSRIYAKESIIVNEDVLMGSNVSVYDHDHILSEKSWRDGGYKVEEVIIGNKVWIGTNCVVTKGSIIKENTVIAANSVVTKPLWESGLYTGCPARIVRSYER